MEAKTLRLIFESYIDIIRECKFILPLHLRLLELYLLLVYEAMNFKKFVFLICFCVYLSIPDIEYSDKKDNNFEINCMNRFKYAVTVWTSDDGKQSVVSG